MPAIEPAGAAELAKNLFGAKKLPAAMPAKSYGFYSKGCFSGGVAIATDGPTWQAMRLSRNRRWGHPTMIKLIEKLSRDAAADGWPGLLLGDISQPRGGPMLTGHASHQIGLDADIWLDADARPQAFGQRAREHERGLDGQREDGLTVDDKLWTPAHARLLKRAASYPRSRAHPGQSRHQEEALRHREGRPQLAAQGQAVLGPRLSFPRPHRLPAGLDRLQGAGGDRPTGEGCDKSLAWWFTEEPWRPNKNPDAPKARDLMTMASLPKACRAVLDAPAPQSEAAVTYRGKAPPAAVASASEPGRSEAAPVAAPGQCLTCRSCRRRHSAAGGAARQLRRGSAPAARRHHGQASAAHRSHRHAFPR